jgi:pimeloyl-ACP methyl ester carboxylesterase
MEQLRFTRRGAGPPLLLIHALGSSSGTWDPVLPRLAERFDVIAVDLPGFGESAALPPGTEPSPARLAGTVADLLDALRLDRPHVTGNSIGGWVALELARLRPLTSLTLLSPAGLWPRGTPLYCLVSLRITRWACRHAAGLLSRLVSHRLGRLVVLGQTHGRPTRVTPEQARAEIAVLGTATGFDAALAATAHRHYTAGPALGIPMTVAFGTRDLVLLSHRWRALDQLPADVHTAELPRCGHIPMSDSPDAVVAVIEGGVEAAAEPGVSPTNPDARARRSAHGPVDRTPRRS